MDISENFSFNEVLSCAKDDASRALYEDLNGETSINDLTASLIDSKRMAKATIVAREEAVICGLPWAHAALKQLDPEVKIESLVEEGQVCGVDQIVMRVHGRACEILTAERTALNFLQLLSAVATQTNRYVHAISQVPNNRAVIVDTRKTIPGLRTAQKYAVTMGGGLNHRIGLFDAILIKENHISAAGGIAEVMRRAKAKIKEATFIEIEVENLSELEQALEAGAEMILLDNMTLVDMRRAVEINAGRAILEVSGGVNFSSVLDIAATGVNRISIGALTKDIKAIDFSMRFEEF